MNWKSSLSCRQPSSQFSNLRAWNSIQSVKRNLLVLVQLTNKNQINNCAICITLILNQLIKYLCFATFRHSYIIISLPVKFGSLFLFIY